VLQIKLGNYINTSGQQESWVASICMCYKLDLETTLTPHKQWESCVTSICMCYKLGNYINTLGAVRNLGCIHLCDANQTWKLCQHLVVARKLGCIHLYVVQIKLENCISTPMASRKLGCIHMYMVQIRPKNYIRTQGINKLWQLLEKKYWFEKKVKHWKGIDQTSKGRGYMGKTSKKQVEKLQENT
jgi:hypothetical protein